MGHCFWALVAKKLSADISSPRVRTNNGMLVYISAIICTKTLEGMPLFQPGSIEIANVISIWLIGW
jgi:hypothetical protein